MRRYLDGYPDARHGRLPGSASYSQRPRDNAAHIPIIAMTANAFQEDVTAALEAGMNAHIAKPVDVAHLYQVLGDYMEQEG